jgi:hypothetical protein
MQLKTSIQLRTSERVDMVSYGPETPYWQSDNSVIN